MTLIQGTVETVTVLTDRICEIQIAARAPAILPHFDAGSHIRVVLPDGGTRAYSLIQMGPTDDRVTRYIIAVQRDPDGQGGSRYMHSLRQGDSIAFEPPKNDFPLSLDTSTVLLAGGIGITPMISMASALAQANQKFTLHYSGRTAKAMAYRATLQARFGDTTQIYCDDAPEKVLDLAALVQGLTPDQHLYVCGPRGMIDAVKSVCDAAGVTAARLHFELFDTTATIEGDTAFEVEINSGQVFEIPAGKTIVEVLEEADIDVMYDCQRGDCGICQVDVIDGTPDHRDVVLSEDERASGKIIQICVSRAKSHRLVLDI